MRASLKLISWNYLQERKVLFGKVGKELMVQKYRNAMHSMSCLKENSYRVKVSSGFRVLGFGYMLPEPGTRKPKPSNSLSVSINTYFIFSSNISCQIFIQ